MRNNQGTRLGATCLIASIALGGCQQSQDAPSNGQKNASVQELLVPLMSQNPSLREAIESSTLLVHSTSEERTGSMQHAEWIYAAPEEITIVLDGSFRHRAEAHPNTTELLNLRLIPKGRRVANISDITGAIYDIEGSQYTVKDIRSDAGRLLYIVRIAR